MINTISFGKKLVATCRLKNTNNIPVKGNIYELNKKDDADYFHKVSYDRKWTDDYFLSIVNYLFLNMDNKNAKYYVVENENGNCLGYVNFLSKDNNRFTVEYIETCPKYTAKNRKRDFKYIGESLMAFVVGLAGKEKIEKVCVPFYRDRVKKFYAKSCKFQKSNDKNIGFYIERPYYTDFLERHLEKTGSKINFIK